MDFAYFTCCMCCKTRINVTNFRSFLMNIRWEEKLKAKSGSGGNERTCMNLN